MQSIITSYLLQSGECSLEHIGAILFNARPAVADPATKQILPPASEIIFKDGAAQSSAGLIEYIAQKKGYSTDVAENILSDFCFEWKERIDAGEAFVFDTIGSLQKNTAGNIYFKTDGSPKFLKPVFAEKVIAQKTAPDVLVDHNEVLSDTLPNDEIEEPAIKKNKWWLSAAVLAAVALALIGYHFSKHNFIPQATGNQTNIVIDSTAATHTEIPGN